MAGEIINQDTAIIDVPSKVREVVKNFKPFGFTKWRYIKNYKLPDPSRRIQVRVIARNDAEIIQKYSDDYKNGDDFPPIVVDDSGDSPSSGGRIVDGVHRTAAKEKNKEVHIEAIIITGVSYEQSSEVIKAQLRLLAQKANSQHGKKSTYDDARGSAMEYLAVNPTVKPTKLAQLLSVSMPTAKSLIAEHNVRNRIEGLKATHPRLNDLRPISSKEGMNLTTIKLLNDYPAWGFSHPIWVELVHLLDDAKLKAPDAKEIIDRVSSTHDEDARMGILCQERETFEDKMDGGALNGKREVSGPVVFRRAAAMILGKGEKEEFRIDYLTPKHKELIPGIIEKARELRNFINRFIATNEEGV